MAADIQHQDAQKLLRIISSTWANRKTLSYLDAAKLLGRVPPQSHARAVAQMCDLLDAAACFVGVPSLALVVVREATGEINKNAWKRESEPRREAIIQRSLDHRFITSDIEAISHAINDLGGRGNIAAWQFLEKIYPGDLLYRRLTGKYDDPASNALDDLGTDIPERSKAEVWLYARNPKVRDAVLLRANGRCEFCGALGFIRPGGTRYLESHHIIALAKDGEDRLTNVIALCPNDHREAHFGERAQEIEAEMILKLKSLAPFVS